MSTAPRYVVREDRAAVLPFGVWEHPRFEDAQTWPLAFCSTRKDAEHVAAALNHLDHMAQLTARAVSSALMHSTSGAGERP